MFALSSNLNTELNVAVKNHFPVRSSERKGRAGQSRAEDKDLAYWLHAGRLLREQQLASFKFHEIRGTFKENFI